MQLRESVQTIVNEEKNKLGNLRSKSCALEKRAYECGCLEIVVGNQSNNVRDGTPVIVVRNHSNNVRDGALVIVVGKQSNYA